MERNMAWWDRLLRFAAAVVLIVLVAGGSVTGAGAVILGIAALVFLITSVAGFCPLYRMLGIRTGPKDKGGR